MFHSGRFSASPVSKEQVRRSRDGDQVLESIEHTKKLRIVNKVLALSLYQAFLGSAGVAPGSVGAPAVPLAAAGAAASAAPAGVAMVGSGGGVGLVDRGG